MYIPCFVWCGFDLYCGCKKARSQKARQVNCRHLADRDGSQRKRQILHCLVSCDWDRGRGVARRVHSRETEGRRDEQLPFGKVRMRYLLSCMCDVSQPVPGKAICASSHRPLTAIHGHRYPSNWIKQSISTINSSVTCEELCLHATTICACIMGCSTVLLFMVQSTSPL